MEQLQKLLTKLRIPRAILCITDEYTGAGYIIVGDTILARWTTYNQGIRLLQAYVDTLSIPNI